jgi:hypothetical protein
LRIVIHDVGGNVIEENQPQRDAAKQIQPQVAFARRRNRHQASSNGGSIR